MCYHINNEEEKRRREVAFLISALTYAGMAIGLALMAAMLVSSLKGGPHV